MGYLTLEITLISAKDLKDVNLIGKMDVYVVVSLSSDPKKKQKTPVHQDGGTNPSWNYTMRFTIDETAALQSNSLVICKLKHEHTLGADKDLGEVHIPVSELVKGSRGQSEFVTYQVKTASGKTKGELRLSYKVIDGPNGQGSCGSGSSSYGQPVTAYSTTAPTGGYPQTYPPPPGGYPQASPPPLVGYAQSSTSPAGIPQALPAGYPQAPPPGGYPTQGGQGPYQSYGYPPQGYPPQYAYQAQPSYGYGAGAPPAGYPGSAQKPQKQKKKKNGGGFGLGAGLVGGAIGGLILGDIVSDAIEDAVDFDC